MTFAQRVPVIEEILLSNSDDQVHNLHNDDARVIESARENANENSTKITELFPNEEDATKNRNVNSTSIEAKHEYFIDHDDAETDDDQFYIDEDARDSETASESSDAPIDLSSTRKDEKTASDLPIDLSSTREDERTASDVPIDLSSTREDERLSSISPSVVSLSSKNSDDDKLSTSSSAGDIVKYLTPEKVVKTDNVSMDTKTASSDEEAESSDAKIQKISMPSRYDRPSRFRGKAYVETICETCQLKRRMSGKLCQNEICCICKEYLEFECISCQKRFPTYQTTLRHLKKQCLSEECWNCPKCPYSVVEGKRLEEHIRKFHMEDGLVRKKSVDGKPKRVYTCKICHVEFSGKIDLRKHKCSKREIVSYRCEVCDYMNASQNDVKTHFANSHVIGQQRDAYSRYITAVDVRPICVPDITSSSNKRKTEEDIRAEEQRLNKSIALHCPKCSRDLKYSGKHIKKCETCDNALRWQCSACKEQSKSYCGIYAHLQSSCTAILQSCKKCDKTFDSPEDFEKHQHVCGQDIYLQCEICNYKTLQKVMYLKHVKVKHDLQDNDICKWL